MAPVDAYIEHMAFGDPLPEMPLFLDAETYIYIPLELGDEAAFEDMPAFLHECSRSGRRRFDGSRWLWFDEGNR